MTTFESTPRPRWSRWGDIDSATQLRPGIWSVSTAGHGGLIVSGQRLDAMPRWMQSTPYSSGGQFEEDCDWCLPVLAFANEFEGDPLLDHAWASFHGSVERGYYKHPLAILFDACSGAVYRGEAEAIVEKR